MYNPINASPLIRILRLPSDNTEALQNIDNIVDASPLDAELPGALIEQEQILLLFPVDAKESSAKFTQ